MSTARRPSLAKLINRLAVGDGRHVDGGGEGLLEVLVATVDADCYAILMICRSTGSVKMLAGKGLSSVDPARIQDLNAPSLTRQALEFPQKPSLCLMGSFHDDSFLEGEGARSLMMACQDAGDVLLATIAFRRKAEAFKQGDRERFGAVASMINLRGLLAHLEESMRTRQEKDPLTGFPRFMGFHGALSREVARARRTGRPLAVGIMSFEGSQQDAEDRHVLDFSSVIREQLRSFDLIARYGPRQFSFVFPDLTAEEGVRVSQRLVDALNRALHADADDLNFFLGISSYPEDASTADRLIEIAEAAMAQAREAGTPGVFKWEH